VYYTPVSSKFMENFVVLNAALVAVCQSKQAGIGRLSRPGWVIQCLAAFCHERTYRLVGRLHVYESMYELLYDSMHDLLPKRLGF
jgi:hypothetical protein